MEHGLRSGLGADNVRRRGFLGALVMAGAAMAVAPHGALAAGSEEAAHTLVGAWKESIASTDGSFPPFETLFTYDAGGGLIGTASIDAMAGLRSSPTVGAWRHLGARSYTWTGHAFSFDDLGNPNGFYNIRETLTVDSSGAGYSGTGTFEVVGGSGAFPKTPYTFSATRIST